MNDSFDPEAKTFRRAERSDDHALFWDFMNELGRGRALRKTNMMKTLIVEDNEDFRTFLKTMLYGRFPDMVIAEAQDGEEALRTMTLFKPDVIFVDINLPGKMNGLMLTERIRESDRETKIIVITSHDLPEYRQAATQYGANHFLAKTSSTSAEILSLMEPLRSK